MAGNMNGTPIALLRFNGGTPHDPSIDDWFAARSPELVSLARPWFDVMRAQGDDVLELLHDDMPTVCINDAAFGYVNIFKAHLNVGFFLGAWIDDPDGLLEGSGKRMRHVKVRPGKEPDRRALTALIERGYAEVKRQIEAGAS